MHRNEFLLTENSKIEHLENNKYYKGNLYNMKQKMLFPFTKNFKNQNNIKNNDILINPNPNNRLMDIKDLSHLDYKYKNENNDYTKNYLNKIYINNYIPRKKKFKVARNEQDIKKYFSKDYKKNILTNDIILSDYDTNNSKRNNIFYLVNNNQSSPIYIQKNNHPYNVEKKLETQSKNNNNNIDNFPKKISKISLPFCIYNYNQGVSKNYACNNKNCPGCIYCRGFQNNNIDNKNEFDLFKNNNLSEDNKINNSFEENQVNPKLLKNSLIEEENIDENESEENKKIEENEEDEEKSDIIEVFESEEVENELSKRGDISIHNLINRIRLPHEYHLRDLNKNVDKNNKKNKLYLSLKFKKKNNTDKEVNYRNIDDNRKRAKSVPKRILIKKEDNDNNKNKIKSVPKKNNYNEKSRGKFIKTKKIEFLRE